MKRKLLIVFIICSLTIELAYIFGEFFSVGSNKIEVTNKLSEVISAEVDIKGGVELKFFPTPKLVISHIRINDFNLGKYRFNIRSSKLVASVSFFKFLRGDIDLGKIILNDTKFSAVLNDVSKTERKISDVLKSDMTLKVVHIVNSELEIFNPKNNSIKRYDDVNLDIVFDGQIEIFGKFKSALDEFNVTASVKESEGYINSKVEVNFSNNNLEFDSSYNGESYTKGNVKIAGSDFQRFVFNNLLSLWFFYPDGRLSSYESKFDFEINGDDINIKNGEIVGDDIEGHFIGDIKGSGVGNINIKFKHLNFATLLTTKKKSYVIEEISHLNLEDETGNFPLLVNNGKVLITGVLENIIIKEHDISPINFSVFLDENKRPKVEHLSFQITPEDFHNVSGVLKQDGVKYEFEGEYESSGNDVNNFLSSVLLGIKLDPAVKEEYSFKSNFNISTDYIKMNDVVATISDNGHVNGDILINFSELDDSIINLDAVNINFDKFLLIDNKDKKRHIFHYIYQALSSREAGNSLLRQMLWLRNLYIRTVLDVDFINAKYNDVLFDNIAIKGNMFHRVLNIEKLHLGSRENDIDVSFMVNLDESRPYLNIDINANKADLGFLNYVGNNTSNRYKWSKDLLYAANLKNMDFAFNAYFKDLKYHELSYQDSEFVMELKDDALDIKKAVGNIGKEGSFEVQGRVILDGLPTLNLSYSLNKFAFGDYVKFFFNIPHIEATANWAGSLYASGNTPYVMIKQLKSKNTFYLADIKVDRLAIPNVVQEIADLSIDPVNSFNVPLEQFIRDGSTPFKVAKGTLNIQKGNVYVDSIKLESPNLKTVIAGKISLVDFAMKFNSVFVFTVFYKVKNSIKKSAITVTHSLEGKFDNITGKFNLFQLGSMVDELKNKYLKLYEKLADEG